MKKYITFFSTLVFLISCTTILKAQFGIADTLITSSTPVDEFKIGDINNDGYPDIITENINYHLGADKLEFGEGITVGQPTVDIELLDFNNDGLLDIFSETEDGLYWIPNLGNGLFDEPILIDNSILNNDNNSSYEIDDVDTDIADLDNDGDQDIIVASTEGLSWFENTNNDIGPATVLIPSDICNRVEPLDFDNDGDMDIIVEHDGGIKLFNNNGDGTFVTLTLFNAGTSLNTEHDFRIQDINNDGKPDIIRTYNDWESCAIHLNNGDNTFNSSNDEFLSLGGNDCKWMFKDMNEDGLLDALLYIFNDLKVMYQQEGFSNLFTSSTALIEDIDHLIAWQLDDIDGDNDSDIVYIDSYQNIKSINLTVGSPRKNNHPFDIADVHLSQYLDMDNDNDLDLLVISEIVGFAWYENDGLGNFTFVETLSSLYCSSNSFYESFFFPFDKENDGDIDVILKCETGISLAHNDNGNYSIVNINQIIASDRRGFILGDLTNDNHLDLISYDDDDNDIRLYPYDPAIESFSTNYTTIYNNTMPSNKLNGLFINDFDNDGDNDLIVQKRNGGAGNQHFDGFPVLLKNDNNSFLEEQIITNERVSDKKLVIADMNNDGLDDILLLENLNFESKLLWFENTAGNDAFSSSHYISDQFFSTIAVADLDEDGDMDILADNQWIECNNGIPFNAIDLYPFPITPEKIIGASDIDNDGTVDLLLDYSWIKPNVSQDDNIMNTHAYLINTADLDDQVIYTNLDSDPYLEILIKRPSSIDWIDNVFDPSTGKNTLVHKGQILSSYNNETITSITLGDIDADGKEELFVSGYEYIVYHKLVQDASYSLPIVINNQATGIAMDKLLLADFNDNGYPDLITSYNSSVPIKIYSNNNGSFSRDSFYFPENNEPYEENVHIIDYDGNGIDNLICANYNNGIYLYEGENLSSSGLLMDGVDTLFIIDLIVRDIDSDNDDDILILAKTASNYSNIGSIHMGINMGNGQFDYLKIIEDIASETATLIDIDNNGLLDILYHRYSVPFQLEMILQDSMHTFSDPQSFQAELPSNFYDVENLYPFDFDQDGDEDLIYHEIVLALRENLSNNKSIAGSFFFDENQNGELDSLEIRLPNYIATLAPQSLYTSTGEDGDFLFKIDAGEHTLGYLLNQDWWSLSSDSSSYTIASDTLSEDHRFDFGFYPNIDTLSISPFVTSATTRCGFTLPFWLTYTNTGTRTSDGTYHFILDSLSTVDPASILPVPDAITGDTITWIFEDLKPTLSHEFFMEITMPNEEHVGTYRNFHAIVESYDTVGDSLYINEFIYQPVLTCAIDPNDKQVSPNRLDEYDVNYTLFDEELVYVIRFQNLGNDTAFNIVVVDQLDDKLDWESFRPISSSHPYNLVFDYPNGLLTFNFDNILLPDATTNEIGSNGYVAFAIKPNTGLEEEDIITNEAYIYFDFNAPIITNEIESVMVSELPTITTSIPISPTVENYITLSPNPISGNSEVLNINTNWDNYYIEIYDVNARLMLQTQTRSKISSISLKNFPAGIFFVHVISLKGEKHIEKLIHIKQ